jgi:hypothetical protein
MVFCGQHHFREHHGPRLECGIEPPGSPPAHETSRATINETECGGLRLRPSDTALLQDDIWTWEGDPPSFGGQGGDDAEHGALAQVSRVVSLRYRASAQSGKNSV